MSFNRGKLVMDKYVYKKLLYDCRITKRNMVESNTEINNKDIKSLRTIILNN